MNTENEYLARQAQKKGKTSLGQAHYTLLVAAQDLARYIDEYNNADQCEEQARVIGCAIDYVSTMIIGELRIDWMADAQAQLLVAASKV